MRPGPAGPSITAMVTVGVLLPVSLAKLGKQFAFNLREKVEGGLIPLFLAVIRSCDTPGSTNAY